MIKRLKRLNSGYQLSVILGPILVLLIALATVNMLSTYKGIHKQKAATLWNVVQLDRAIANTLFSSQQFINGELDSERLRVSYQTLKERFPDTFSSLVKDKIVQQVSGLSDPVYSILAHVESADKVILISKTIDKSQLNEWSNKLSTLKKQLDEQVLDTVASTTGAYSEKAFKTIIKTAAILLTLIFTFMIYLGYLLFALSRERKRNLYMLAHDPLTGLSSRECIMTSLQSRCNNEIPFALLLFDLNKFKVVNDTFGHHAGDQLLIHLAGKFKETLGKFGIVGRLGGDEFVWLSESDNPDIIDQQYALFLKALKDPCLIRNKRLFIEMSTGGGIAKDYDFQSTQLLERVDEAMYQAKAMQLREIYWESKISYKPLAPQKSDDTQANTSTSKRTEVLEYS